MRSGRRSERWEGEGGGVDVDEGDVRGGQEDVGGERAVVVEWGKRRL